MCINSHSYSRLYKINSYSYRVAIRTRVTKPKTNVIKSKLPTIHLLNPAQPNHHPPFPSSKHQHHHHKKKPCLPTSSPNISHALSSAKTPPSLRHAFSTLPHHERQQRGSRPELRLGKLLLLLHNSHIPSEDYSPAPPYRIAERTRMKEEAMQRRLQPTP